MLDDSAIRHEVYGYAQELHADDRDVEAVLSKLRQEEAKSPRIRSRAGAAVAVVAGALTLAVATPVGGAVDDVAANFTNYLTDGDSGQDPGTGLSPSDLANDPNAPSWVTGNGTSDQRVLADTGGHKVYVARRDDGEIVFTIDNAVAVAAKPEEWLGQLADEPLSVIAALPRRGDSPLTPMGGITAAGVDRVRVAYREGSTTSASASGGGFVALVNPDLEPTRLQALNSNGSVVGEIDLTYISWQDL